jgi:uncharacterized membrane protein
MQRSQSLALMLGALCLSALSAQAADLVCQGTKPFWRLEITKTEMSFEDGNKVSGYSDFELKSVKPRTAAGAPPDAVRIYETKTGGKHAIQATVIVQKREETKCHDNLSDPVYPYDVILITPRAVFVGCCK